MSMPSNGRPDSSVNPGGDFQLAESFQLLISQVEALTRVIQNQTTVTERTASAEARYSIQTSLRQPQLSQQAMQSMQMAGGVQGLSGGTAQITPTGSLSSLQNLQAFGAQRLGSWLYGTPTLFTPPGGGGQQQQAQGSTPVGTPTSTAAPAGSGAQAAAAAGAAVAGGAAASGAGGSSQAPPALGGLPGRVFGAQGPQTPVGQYGLASMQLLGSRIAMSGGSPGGILSAIKGLPGVGLLADIYNKGMGIFQSQYQAGRQFQEVEGGTNLGAQTERLHQAAYQASMLFTPMGAGPAGQAFNAVTALGYNQAAVGEQQFGGAGPYGQNRQGALNFIYHNYTQAGMPVDQSTQVLQTASQNSVIQLGQVSQALINLSTAAGKAGDNANVARQQFEQAFGVAVGQGAATGSAALAGGVAQTQAAYGKQFAGTSFAGELGQNRQYLLAGQYGITPGQAQFLQRTQPNQYLNMIAGQNAGFINQLGIPASDLASLQQMIQQAGGSSAIKLNPDLADQIGNQWLNTDQWAINNANLGIWAAVLSSLTQIPLTPQNVMQWIVQQLAGNNEAANQPVKAGTPSGSSVPAGRTAGAPTGQYGLATTTTVPGAAGAHGVVGTRSLNWQQTLLSKSGTAAQAYLSEEKTAGQRSPVLEGLLQNLSQGDQVQVQTKNGPRVMSFTDAMKYYPDELMAGNVMFFNSSGSKMLGTTSNITHGLTSTNAAGVAAEERSAAGSHLGVTSAAWRKSHPGAYAAASSGAGVTVTLTKEAAQLLKVLPGNNDTAAASATAPSPPWPSISSR